MKLQTMGQLYEVGRYYKVPAIEARLYGRLRLWPVMGPAHDDREIIGFPYLHLHLDARFIAERDWHWLIGERHGVNTVFATPLTFGLSPLGQPTCNASIEPDTITSKMRCKREMPPYPAVRAKWLLDLEAAMADRCLKNMRCPHRGYDLSSLPAANGVVTCPLHGLSWNVQTGRLVTAERV